MEGIEQRQQDQIPSIKESMDFLITRSYGSDVVNLIVEISTTKTIKRCVLKFGGGVGVKLKGTVSFFKEWYKTIFGATFFFFLRLNGTLINENLKLEGKKKEVIVS